MTKMTLVIFAHLNVYDPTIFPLTVGVKGAVMLFNKPADTACRMHPPDAKPCEPQKTFNVRQPKNTAKCGTNKDDHKYCKPTSKVKQQRQLASHPFPLSSSQTIKYITTF